MSDNKNNFNNNNNKNKNKKHFHKHFKKHNQNENNEVKNEKPNVEEKSFETIANEGLSAEKVIETNFKYVYGVTFKLALQTYYFGSDDDSFKVNDRVVVETVRGVELATIANERKDVKNVKLHTALKPIVRLATKEDIKNNEGNAEKCMLASQTFTNCVNDLKLDMFLVSSEFTLDGQKVIFTYIADERVDFRELLKVLANKLHCRIELKQIGARDRAKVIGGLGPCGLPLCCATFLSDFEGISINMAKNQLLALNISKLSGQCGKLICCLKYEDSIYSELRAGLPKLGQRCIYKNEEYKITSMNVLSKTMKLDNKDNTQFITFEEYFKEAKPNDAQSKLSK